MSVGALMCGCEQQTSQPFAAGQARAAEVAVNETRPEWWSDVAVGRGGVLSVCASAEDRDLLGARRQAVVNAARMFAEVAGHAAREPELHADSIRLLDGIFRAYVRPTGAK